MIAAELNVTRNAVIGKCHRLGLNAKKELAKTIVAKPVPENKIKPVVNKASPVKVPKIAIVTNEKAETSNDNLIPHMWVYRRNDLCKWPGTDRKIGPVFKCEQTRLFGKPYCKCHWQKSIYLRRK